MKSKYVALLIFGVIILISIIVTFINIGNDDYKTNMGGGNQVVITPEPNSSFGEQ